jgi:hypothetical protein
MSKYKPLIYIITIAALIFFLSFGITSYFFNKRLVKLIISYYDAFCYTFWTCTLLILLFILRWLIKLVIKSTWVKEEDRY